MSLTSTARLGQVSAFRSKRPYNLPLDSAKIRFRSDGLTPLNEIHAIVSHDRFYKYFAPMLYDMNEPWACPSRIIIALDVGVKRSQVLFVFPHLGVGPSPNFVVIEIVLCHNPESRMIIHRLNKWPYQATQATASIPTASMLGLTKPVLGMTTN
jgi:hypothetical protein